MFKYCLNLSWGIILLCLPVSLCAQQQDDNLQTALEDLAEENEEVTEDDESWQQIQLYQKHPLNLNFVTSEDLKTFPFLNTLQTESLIQYRKLLGRLISIYELQAVPQWDVGTIKKLLPYVYVNDDPFEKSYRFKDYFHQGNTEIVFRYKRDIEKKKGYIQKDSLSKPHYLSDPNNLFIRIRYRFSNSLSMGMTADRDAGEPFLGNGQKGFDFYSAHFFLKDHKKLRAFAVGDYKINFGQGLINKQGLSYGKSSMVMNIDHEGPTILPHTSPMENGFYRGTAISFGKMKTNTTLFISYKQEDASLSQSDTMHSYFNTFQKSGYHRSLTELKNKNSENVLSAGGSFRYNVSKGHIAINAVYHHFRDSMKRSDHLYGLYGFEGKEMVNASLDYSFLLHNLYFLGETAVNQSGAIATVNGVILSADPKIDLSILYRNYSSAYTFLYAQSFGENSRPQNERGFYLGATIRPATHWQIDAFGDLFSFPWLKYQLDEPSDGKEFFIQSTYSPSKKYMFYMRYRFKEKYLNEIMEEPVAAILPTRKQNIRLLSEWKYSNRITFRNIGEISMYNKVKTSVGYLLAQDILWKTKKSFSGNMRLEWFQTDDFDSRIYVYENDVRYTYAIPFLYGKGIRSYLNLRMNVGKKCSIWTKLSRTWYLNQETIGSGYDEIKGNKRTNITAEIIYDLK